MRKFKGGQIYPFDALNDQNFSVKRKGLSIFTIKFNFWVQKAQKRSNETARRISNPPLNETLSHSNGKVVFDHGPKTF